MIPIWYLLFMKMITRSTDYAVRAVCRMAKKDKGVISVTELVRELGIPRPFLRKILQTLNRYGLVRSYKGIGGGFSLARNPDKIRLADIIAVFQGPFRMNECIFKKRLCPNRKTCPLKKRVDEIERRASREIGLITIGSLLRA
jgi:Rrf2 family protein